MRLLILLVLASCLSGCLATMVTTAAVKSAATVATLPVAVTANVVEAIIPDKSKKDEKEEDD